MSTQIIWAPRELPATGAVNQVVLDNRLSTLRDVALTILREVESLRISEPVNVNHRVRLYDEVQRFEIELISSALSRTGGNQTQAAQILGVKLTTLNSKIKRYKIPTPDDYPVNQDLNEARESVA